VLFSPLDMECSENLSKEKAVLVWSIEESTYFLSSLSLFLCCLCVGWPYYISTELQTANSCQVDHDRISFGSRHWQHQNRDAEWFDDCSFAVRNCRSRIDQAIVPAFLATFRSGTKVLYCILRDYVFLKLARLYF
jgi:hypothetical protein